jgi:hypothetical protein
MKMKEKKKAKQGRLKIRVVLTAGAAGLLGACSAGVSNSPVDASPSCQGSDCGVVSDQDGGHDGGVDAGQNAGEDGGRDGGDAG